MIVSHKHLFHSSHKYLFSTLCQAGTHHLNKKRQMGSISDVHINSSINLWNGNLQDSIQLPVNAPLFVDITILSALV